MQDSLLNFSPALTLPDASLCVLAYHRWGTGGKRVLFCVHGLTRNGADFAWLARRAVQAGYDVIAPDMPGRGHSAPLANPALYSNPVNADLCRQLLVALGMAQVDWLGTSMGGIIGLLLAHQHPGSIRRCILNDVGCVVPGSALRRIGQYVGDNSPLASFEAAEARLRARTMAFGIPQEAWPEFVARSVVQEAGGWRLNYDPAIAQNLAMLGDEDLSLWPLWEAVKPLPVLLVRGEASDLLTEVTAQAMQSAHPRLQRLNVAGAAHAPALMTDAEIAPILAFLAAA